MVEIRQCRAELPSIHAQSHNNYGSTI